jgi:hypothetical protein
MPSRIFKRLLCAILVLSAGVGPAFAERTAVFDSVAVELPFQGGGLVMARRTKVINRFLRIGGVIGGGAINRKFNITSGSTEFDAETHATILPYIGPQVQLSAGYVGISLSYGVFWARTKFNADAPGVGRLSGRTSGWGTGFYAPLLILDFYDRDRNAVVGVGLGGFLGATYPDLKGTNGSTSLTTDESPIDTLSVHVSVTWPLGSWPVRQSRRPKDDDL